MSGRELYEHWAGAMADHGVGVDAWDDLDDNEKDAWEDVGRLVEDTLQWAAEGGVV